MIVEYIRYKLTEHQAVPQESVATAFEAAYQTAASSLDASPHCLGYELSRCVEEQDRYILRIEWDSIDGHLTGFRRGPEFANFLAAIKPYIHQIEEMQHYALTSVVLSKRN
ncbi:MAG: antibiotic biosynthesis monooxygenase family protein [Pseudomonadota bacterium]